MRKEGEEERRKLRWKIMVGVNGRKGGRGRK